MEIFGKICLETDSSPNVQLKVYHKRDRTHLNFRNITGLKSETELSYLIIWPLYSPPPLPIKKAFIMYISSHLQKLINMSRKTICNN